MPPAASVADFTLGELYAIRHQMQGVIPDDFYEHHISAAAKIDARIAALLNGG